MCAITLILLTFINFVYISVNQCVAKKLQKGMKKNSKKVLLE